MSDLILAFMLVCAVCSVVAVIALLAMQYPWVRGAVIFLAIWFGLAAVQYFRHPAQVVLLQKSSELAAARR